MNLELNDEQLEVLITDLESFIENGEDEDFDTSVEQELLSKCLKLQEEKGK